MVDRRARKAPRFLISNLLRYNEILLVTLNRGGRNNILIENLDSNDFCLHEILSLSRKFLLQEADFSLHSPSERRAPGFNFHNLIIISNPKSITIFCCVANSVRDSRSYLVKACRRCVQSLIQLSG